MFDWNNPPEGGNAGEDFGCRGTADPSIPAESEFSGGALWEKLVRIAFDQVHLITGDKQHDPRHSCLGSSSIRIGLTVIRPDGARAGEGFCAGETNAAGRFGSRVGLVIASGNGVPIRFSHMEAATVSGNLRPCQRGSRIPAWCC